MSSTEEITEDSGMYKVMAIVITALFVLALCIGGAANLIGGGNTNKNDTLMRNALVQRIQPVGGVRTSADSLPEAAPMAMADAAGAFRSDEELVAGVCAACHQAGVGGAPLLGDEAAWAERRELGLDALVASVMNGKGSMPARGGSDYSDEEIRRSVQHIALFEDASEGAEEVAADESAPESAPATDAEQSSEKASDESAAAPDQATEETSEQVAEPVSEPVSEPRESDSAATETEADSANTELALAEDATAPAAVASVAWVVGQAPADLPAHVKTTVDGVCSGCHIAGVAGAHKIGDTAAWATVAEVGLDALTASVIAGKGVMPPRGGSALTDGEISIAIQYLTSK